MYLFFKMVISVNASDINLVDMLVDLARENNDTQDSVDRNSILGSQQLQLAQEFTSDNEEEDDDVSDLNLTTFQLDTMNSLDYKSSRSTEPTPKQSGDNAKEDRIYELTPTDSLISNITDIPQFDGAANNSSSESEPELDHTVERRENLICAYNSTKRKRAPEYLLSTTPKKRKVRATDDHTRSTKRRSVNLQDLQKTPCRSPRRVEAMKSPSCPGRSYSPLSLVITSPKTKKSDCTSPGPSKVRNIEGRMSPSTCVTPRRSKLRETFLREKVFSPLKECSSGLLYL